MFSTNRSDSRGSPSNQAIENQSSRMVAGEGGGAQDFCIVLVSIMSAFYQNPNTLKHMMEIVRDHHTANTPIVYLCGDSVYETTKDCLFPSEGRDPVEKARTNWKKRYDEVIKKFEDDQKIIFETVVYWNTVKSDDSYIKIKTFIDTVFNLTLSVDQLQNQFPLVESQSISNLVSRIQLLDIGQMISAIALEFKDKNLGKLKEKERKNKGKKKKDEHLSDLLHSKLAGYGLELKNAPKAEQEQNETYDSLLKGTSNFLAEEFAVFMNLSLPTDIASMSAKCGLNIHQLTPETLVRPLLHYPISSTKGSTLIFQTFQAVQRIYIEYCQLLNLPIIAHPTEIFDLEIPEDLRPAKRSQLAKISEAQKLPSIVVADPNTTLVANVPSALFCQQTNENSRDIQETTEKIIRMIDGHCKSVDLGIHKNTKLKYKNGIKCDIDVKKSPNTSIQEPRNDISELQQNNIKETIEDAVCSVKNDDAAEIEILIEYLGYSISLKMSVTQLSPRYSPSVQHYIEARL